MDRRRVCAGECTEEGEEGRGISGGEDGEWVEGRLGR